MCRRAMTKRFFGGALIGAGLVLAIGPVILVAWLHRMYTTGLGVRAPLTFSLFGTVALSCILLGARLRRIGAGRVAQ